MTRSQTQGEHDSQTMLVDDSDFPYVYIDFPRHCLSSEENVVELLAWMKSMFDAAKPFAAVFDLSKVTLPPAHLRAMAAEFQRENLHKFERYLLADAMVIRSGAIRGLLTAINWMSPPRHPQRVFATKEEATSWAKATYLERMKEREADQLSA